MPANHNHLNDGLASDIIPPPAEIRQRIYVLTTEASLLRRLLRISADRTKVLPAAGREAVYATR